MLQRAPVSAVDSLKIVAARNLDSMFFYNIVHQNSGCNHDTEINIFIANPSISALDYRCVEVQA